VVRREWLLFFFVFFVFFWREGVYGSQLKSLFIKFFGEKNKKRQTFLPFFSSDETKKDITYLMN